MALTDEVDYVVGVDTHMGTHTAAVCDARGGAVSQLQVPATAAGYVDLLAWVSAAAGSGTVAWAVEGYPALRAGPGSLPVRARPAGDRDR